MEGTFETRPTLVRHSKRKSLGAVLDLEAVEPARPITADKQPGSRLSETQFKARNLQQVGHRGPRRRHMPSTSTASAPFTTSSLHSYCCQSTELTSNQKPSYAFTAQPLPELLESTNHVPHPVRWNEIPDDILRRILHFLPSHSLRPARLTCAAWRLGIDRTLTFARPEQLTLASMPNLRNLDLSSCKLSIDVKSSSKLVLRSQLQDADLVALTTLHRLETLVLKDCPHITDYGLHLITSSLPALHTLDLTNCTGLKNEAMRAIATHVNLRTVTLFGCTGLTDDCLFVFLASGRLQRLALPPAVTDAGLQLLAGARNLERIAVRGCTNVGAAGIAALLAAPSLTRVIVSKCPGVSAEELRVLPNLRVTSCGTSQLPATSPADMQLLMDEY